MKNSNLFLTITALLSLRALCGCPGFSMGTRRTLPNMINKGKVSNLYDPNSDTNVYTPYDQQTDFVYIKYNGDGGRLTVSY